MLELHTHNQHPIKSPVLMLDALQALDLRGIGTRVPISKLSQAVAFELLPGPLLEIKAIIAMVITQLHVVTESHDSPSTVCSYVEELPFGLLEVVLGHHVTLFLGPDRS